MYPAVFNEFGGDNTPATILLSVMYVFVIERLNRLTLTHVRSWIFDDEKIPIYQENSVGRWQHTNINDDDDFSESCSSMSNQNIQPWWIRSYEVMFGLPIGALPPVCADEPFDDENMLFCQNFSVCL